MSVNEIVLSLRIIHRWIISAGSTGWTVLQSSDDDDQCWL